jgi:hypothetical protein
MQRALAMIGVRVRVAACAASHDVSRDADGMITVLCVHLHLPSFQLAFLLSCASARFSTIITS